MPSRTIWQRLYDDPGDEARWREFRLHYDTRVYNWAIRILDGDVDAAAEVTEQVFRNLHRTITTPDAKRVQPRDNTCAGYVFRAVENACEDHRRARKRTRLTQQMWARLRSVEAFGVLDRLIAEAEAAERDPAPVVLARFRTAYERAVLRYHQSPQASGRTWPMFLRAYGADPRPGAGLDLDAEFGVTTRGYVLKAAHRVAERLFSLMNEYLSPELTLKADPEADWERSETILREMVKRHGDPSRR